MKIKQLVIIGGFAASFAAASVASAEGSGFAALDADGDNYISMEEADSNDMLKNSWDAVDKNKDGKLEKAEFSAFEEKAAAPAK